MGITGIHGETVGLPEVWTSKSGDYAMKELRKYLRTGDLLAQRLSWIIKTI